MEAEREWADEGHFSLSYHTMGGLIGRKCHVQEANRNSEPKMNMCLDAMFLHTKFTASGRGENRHFAGHDKMFPGTLVDIAILYTVLAALGPVAM